MTTLSFNRKNNLLSFLRGYDLLFKRNYLNAALLGYGKHSHHHHHHHHHHHKENETTISTAENKYEKFLSTVFRELEKYFNFFREHIPDDSFWYNNKLFFEALCAFTRYFIASKTTTSSEFLSNIETFLTDIIASDRYSNLLDEMDSFADQYKETKKLPEEYIKIKEECGNDIREICSSPNVLDLIEQTFINLILDCIVYSTNVPEEFALKFEKYKDKVTTSYEDDISRLFSEDLQDTAYSDDLESDGEPDSEDEKFVVPDDEEYIEYEDDSKEKPVKRRKIVSSDDEKEVNGSGFYDWWW